MGKPNKRQHSRFLVQFPIRVRESDGPFFEGTAVARDVSEGGLRVAFPCQCPYPQGARVEITLDVPGDRPEHDRINAEAQVTWAKESECGLQFRAIASKDLEIIRTLVKRLKI